jgi:ATP-dependent helicase HrpB
VASPLPIDPHLPEIAGALERHGAAVLRAPTGSGKTTRVPPALAGQFGTAAGGGRVLVLEPRRIAARAAAQRIADERGWTLGREVGYDVRFDRKVDQGGATTGVLFVTEGMMVRTLQEDPFLEGVGLVIFDEFHERNLDADLALGMVERLRRDARDDLRVLVMSATLDPEPVAAYLDGCPRIEAPGRLHPVEVRYADRSLPRDPRGLREALAPAVTGAARRLAAETDGDVLVFLPGVGEISMCAEALTSWATGTGATLLPLHGSLSLEEQSAALRPRAERKVILATNVVESSVTVEGVTAVVDSGLARQMRQDSGSGLNRLELTRISRASADQRAGRAGRTAPGVCLRLWPEIEHAALPAAEAPEVRRVELSGAVLELLAWGETRLSGGEGGFPWFEAPPPGALDAALDLLRRLGALGDAGITPLGQTLARLPVHPRLGRLLVASHRRGYAEEAALLAAMLSERPPFSRPGGSGPPRDASRASRSDLLDRLEALEEFERTGHDWSRHSDQVGRVRRGAVRFVLRTRDQLARLLQGLDEPAGPAVPGDRDESLLRAIFVAHADRLVRRRAPGSDAHARGVMVGGRGVRLARESALSASDDELFVAVDLDDRGRGRAGAPSEALVRLASAVERSWLAELEDDRLSERDEVVFDPARERVVAHRVTRFDDLELDRREVPVTSEERGEAARLLAQAAAENPERALALDEPEVAGLLERARFLRRWMPELELPDLATELVENLLPGLIAAGATTAGGLRSFADLRRLPLADVLRGTLPHHQLQALDREAPERIRVPSGSRVRLRYRGEEPPVLPVRIQEVYGLTQTPRVAGGRVPVLLHLLAPNMRPQQVTDDLASFWRNTYPEVRKELAGRYPKHAWPEDPTREHAERRPGRKK